MKLIEMPAAAFEPFMADLKARYTADQRQANLLSTEAANRFVDNQWAQILPLGRATPDHHFFQFVDDSHTVRGESWLFVHGETRMAFIYELFLHEEARGQGLGRQLLDALTEFAANHGAQSLGLNVFAHNERARALYSSYGFNEVSSNMVMRLKSGGNRS